MTKTNILKVATQEFSKYGYDAVSMNKLADKLNINKATIYYHFKDKQSLYQEMLKNLLHLNKEISEQIINSDLEPKEKFKEYIKNFIQSVKNNPQIVSISLRELANLGANVDNSLGDDFEQEMKDLRAIVLQLNLKDKYKTMDFYELKAVILGTINTYYSMQMSHVDVIGIKDFNQNSDDVLNYLNEFISNILVDALCKD
ncbi:MAG: TetR/AcrR family transcriptional regulator [Campylobacterota bacterium]|nr:TetR/AcrR family transcriptional regulator [Campylobacterota bacterium]